MYTVHLNVTKLERGTKMSAKNTEITGLWVFGNEAKGSGSEPWEKFLMDWNAADEISIIESAGVGANVDIGMEKEGRFWNIKSVVNKGGSGKPTSGGPPANTSQPSPQQKQMFQQPDTPTPAPVLAPVSAPSAVDYKVVSVNRAIDLTIGMMENGVLKGTKVTPQIVYEGVIILAERLADFLENGGEPLPKSDASPLDREPGCDDGDPGPCPEDDIPF